MLLITHSLGLGSVWVELAPVMRIVKEVLAENGVKEDTAVAVLPIGRPRRGTAKNNRPDEKKNRGIGGVSLTASS